MTGAVKRLLLRFLKAKALIDQCISSGSNFVLGVLAARSASIEDFGKFSLVYLIYTTVILLMRSTVGQSLLLDWAERKGRAVRSVGQLAALLSCVAVLIVGEVVFAGWSEITVALMIGTLFGVAQDTSRYIYISEGNWARPLYSDSAWLISMCVSAALAATLGQLTLTTVTASWAVGSFVSAALLVRAEIVDAGAAFGWIRERRAVLASLLGETSILNVAGYALNFAAVAFGGYAGYGVLRATQVVLSPVAVFGQTALINLLRTPRDTSMSRKVSTKPFLQALALLEIGLIGWFFFLMIPHVGYSLFSSNWVIVSGIFFVGFAGQAASLITLTCVAWMKVFFGPGLAFRYRLATAWGDPAGVGAASAVKSSSRGGYRSGCVAKFCGSCVHSHCRDATFANGSHAMTQTSTTVSSHSDDENWSLSSILRLDFGSATVAVALIVTTLNSGGSLAVIASPAIKVAATVLALVVAVVRLRGHHSGRRFNLLATALVLFSIVVGLNTVAQPLPAQRVLLFGEYILLGVAIALIAARKASSVLSALSWSAIVHLALAILVPSSSEAVDGALRLTGGSHPIQLGFESGLVASLGLVSILWRSSRRTKGLGSILLVAGASVALLAFSRQGLVGAATALALIVVLAPGRARLLRVAIVLTIFGAAAISLGSEGIAEVLGATSFNSLSTATGRTDIWTRIVQSDSGLGLHGFGYASLNDGDGPDFGVYAATGGEDAENAPLQVLLNAGYPGLVGWSFVMIVCLAIIVRSRSVVGQFSRGTIPIFLASAVVSSGLSGQGIQWWWLVGLTFACVGTSGTTRRIPRPYEGTSNTHAALS